MGHAGAILNALSGQDEILTRSTRTEDSLDCGLLTSVPSGEGMPFEEMSRRPRGPRKGVVDGL